MKIRSDFVTNSSTASYVLLGFEIPEDFDFAPMFFDWCDGGRFSCYIDAVKMEMKKCSFDSSLGYQLGSGCVG